MSINHQGNEEDSQCHQPPAQVLLTSFRPVRHVVTTINSSTRSYSNAVVPSSFSSSFTTPTRAVLVGGDTIGSGGSAFRGDLQCRTVASPDSVTTTVTNVIDSYRQVDIQQRPPSRAGSSSGHPPNSPPKKIENYKTEMCKNILEHGTCRYENGCFFAHSEEERRSPVNVPDGQLIRPCLIWTMTGRW
jgi:hypothetical protein